MQRLRSELHETFENSEAITVQALEGLSYLNACINEGLRLVPVLNSRYASRVSPGAVISGLFVPKGILVHTNSYTIQRSDRYWADPTLFKPERWLENGPDLYSDDCKATFKPFGLGARVCIGKHVALQNLRYTLANLVYRFEMVPVKPEKFVWERDAESSFF